jgi:putative Ca2+/H+ antiporter (TMEM165/GDT1 family)
MVLDYISAVALIFFAEMGDKTQFLAMAFATKYPVKKILLGVAIGSFLNHGLAMVLGKGLMSVLPKEMIGFFAGWMFLFFAFQSLKVEDESVEENPSRYGPVLTVAIAFFIGELGDKTQLAALGLSIGSNHIFMTLLGTVTGMVLTSSIGIFIGLKLGRKIPEDKLKTSAFLIFILFGVQKLYGSYLHLLQPLLLALMAIFLMLLMLFAHRHFMKNYLNMRETGFRLQAEALKATKEKLQFKVVNMCNGEETCGTCLGGECLIGRMKMLLTKGSHPLTDADLSSLKNLKYKKFDELEAREVLEELIIYYDKYPSEFNDNLLFREIRKNLEYMLVGRILWFKDYTVYKQEIFEALNRN